MIKIKHTYTLLICLLLSSNLVMAQQENDDTSTSTEFLFEEFTDGVVTFKDGRAISAKLNYNTALDQMQFKDANNEILYIGEPEKVIKVVIAKRSFIFVKNYFVELLSEGPVSLCLRIHQTRNAVKIGAYGGESSLSSISSLSSVTLNDGQSTKLSANEKVRFKSDLIFYVMNNGKTKIVLNQNELLKCFPSSKDQLKQELEKQQTKFTSVQSVKMIVDWINGKGIKD